MCHIAIIIINMEEYVMNLGFENKHHFKSKPEKYGEIGKIIYAKLNELHMSEGQFAKAVGMSPSYLTHIMRGQYDDSPKIPIILKYLGIKLNDKKSA